MMRWPYIASSLKCLDCLSTDPRLLRGIGLIRRKIHHQLATLSQALHAHPCSLEISARNIRKEQLGGFGQRDQIVLPQPGLHPCEDLSNSRLFPKADRNAVGVAPSSRKKEQI